MPNVHCFFNMLIYKICFVSVKVQKQNSPVNKWQGCVKVTESCDDLELKTHREVDSSDAFSDSADWYAVNACFSDSFNGV